MKKIKQYRRTYPYICSGCGKGRYTLVFDRKKRGLCHSCLKDIPVPGQINLIDEEVKKATTDAIKREDQVLKDAIVGGATTPMSVHKRTFEGVTYPAQV